MLNGGSLCILRRNGVSGTVKVNHDSEKERTWKCKSKGVKEDYPRRKLFLPKGEQGLIHEEGGSRRY